MRTDQNPTLRSGLFLCLIPILGLPLGLLAIGGGPCAGPSNIFGSLILLSVGGLGACSVIYGGYMILRRFSAASGLMRLWSFLALGCGAAITVVCALFLILGFVSFVGYLQL
jgi:hypothetical protein